MYLKTMKTNQKANHQLKSYNLFLLSLFRISVHVYAHVHARVCTCVRMSIICDIATFPLHQSTILPTWVQFSKFWCPKYFGFTSTRSWEL